MEVGQWKFFPVGIYIIVQVLRTLLQRRARKFGSRVLLQLVRILGKFLGVFSTATKGRGSWAVVELFPPPVGIPNRKVLRIF